MNEKQLQSRASRILARLNAMGFTKNGKPMVIDQAFELVAAEEGHRNQHALRSKLADPKEAAAAETEGRNQWLATCLRMGWNGESQLTLLQAFLAEKGLLSELGAYAQAAAKDELSCGSDEPSEAAVAALQKLGYRLANSDFGQPYWEFDDEGSTDFACEEAAWADAWENAQARTVATSDIASAAWNVMPEEARVAAVLSTLGQYVREKRMLAAADEAFEDYDFGENQMVVASGGWEWGYIFDQATRSVFLQDRRTPDADSKHYRFMVDFADGKVSEVTLYRPAIRG